MDKLLNRNVTVQVMLAVTDLTAASSVLVTLLSHRTKPPTPKTPTLFASAFLLVSFLSQKTTPEKKKGNMRLGR